MVDRKIKKIAIINKKLGKTPLEAILDYKKKTGENRPMTYAGRLDPMAEGLLLCLIGDKCKNKEEYLKLDKEYQFEILTGFSTDTHDLLGLITKTKADIPNLKTILKDLKTILKKSIGKQYQTYPAYSSKTIKGKSLHSLSRAGLIKNYQLPKRKIEVYKLRIINTKNIKTEDLKVKIKQKINLVNGDFRQKEILKNWDKTLKLNKEKTFNILKIKIFCSSGTYIRALVRDISDKINIPLCVYNIIRTKIGNYKI